MLPLFFMLALSMQSPTEPAAEATTVAACTASRLRDFVSPTGVRQAWPVTDSLPPLMAPEGGELLSDQGLIMDGYTQTLHVNTAARSAYVVQQGGIAGIRTIYGPLPVAACEANAPTPSR